MKDKVNILFSSFPDFSGNPKALYEYILNTYPDKFNLYWVIYDMQSLSYLENKNIDFIIFKSERYNEVISNVDIIFDTNGYLLSEKRDGQLYINMWHGSSPKKKGYLLPKENFAEQDEEYYKIARQKTDFLLVPSEFTKLIFSSVFNMNPQRVLSLGYPRDEYLLKSDGISNLQKLTERELKQFKKIIFYLPTFRNGCNRIDSNNIFENNILNLEAYSEDELLEFLEKNNYLLVIKKHPAELNDFSSIKSKYILLLDEDEMKKKDITIYEILNSCDLLIADYSSVYVEFLLLEKPVLFFHRDINEYTKNRGLILQESNIWFPGPKASSFSEFSYELINLLNNSNYYKKERKDFRYIMFNKNIENISKDIFEYFFDINNFTLKYKPFISIEEQQENTILILKEQIKEMEKQVESIKNEKNTILEGNNKLKQEIERIYSSRSWKLFKLVQRIKKGEKN